MERYIYWLVWLAELQPDVLQDQGAVILRQVFMGFNTGGLALGPMWH